ncbi:probable cytochrome P450 304a1 [Anabrus simplex]|uniref:probable cytochrome P450 304a1 n=1 Tax=Anabrus simplex TaxID=316456 RepID=UPI0035A38147
MSPVLLLAVIVLLGVLLYRHAVSRPPNFPPGPIRLPVFGSYLQLLIGNYAYHYRILDKMTLKYKSKILGFYIGSLPTIVACDYESIKEILLRPEFQGRIDSIITRTRALGKKLGVFFVDGPFWEEQRRFALRHMRDFGFGRRSKTLESQIEREIRDLIDVMEGSRRAEKVHKNGLTYLPDILYPGFMNTILAVLMGMRFSRDQDEKLRILGNKIMLFQRSDDQLLLIAIDFFFPAATALSTTITQVIIYMMHYPEVCRKVQMELDSVVGRNKLPTLDDRPSLPYTEATLREAMRRTTLTPISVPHRAIKDTYLKGYFVPKNTVMITHLWSMHMSKEFWGDPEAFRPERFLDENGFLKKKDLTLPFGAGKRLCAGETFARNNLFLFFAAIMQNFNFQMPDGKALPDINNQIPGLIETPGEFWVQAIPRP